MQDALKARRETKQYKNSSCTKHKLRKQNTQNNQEPKLEAPYNQVTENKKLPKAKKTPPKAITAAQQKHTKGWKQEALTVTTWTAQKRGQNTA